MLTKLLDNDGLNSTDYIIIVIFLVFLLALAFITGIVTRHRTLLALTFAGRNLGFMTMAISITMAENGMAQMSGQAGWAVRSGIGIYAYSLVSVLGVLFLGWVFMPVYMASGSLTTIDYAKKRFGGRRIQIVMVILMLVINVVAKVSVELHVANVLLMRLYAVPYGTFFFGLMAGSVILAFFGGLFSLVYTNVWQFLFYITGMPVVFLFSYWTLYSWEDIIVKYQRSWPATTIQHLVHSTGSRYTKCGIPDRLSKDIVRSHNDPVLPWPGMIFGIFIIAVYNFCIDQSILQFCLCGKNIVHVKYACIVSGFFKILSIFLIIPGFIARILFTDTVACADPDVCEKVCGKRSGCEDLALPLIFQKVVPPGWRGLVLSAFLAASLTSIAATLHAGSTVFTFNLYRILRPRAREAELTIVGKLTLIVQAVFGLVLVKLVQEIALVHDFIRLVYASLVPPLVALYIIAVFWRHVTEMIAFRSLVLGSVFSFIRMIWQMVYGAVPCGDEAKFPVPEILKNFHDLHFAIFLFVICSSYIIIAGMTSEPVNKVHMYRLIFWLRHNRENRIDITPATPAQKKDVLEEAYQGEGHEEKFKFYDYSDSATNDDDEKSDLDHQFSRPSGRDEFQQAAEGDGRGSCATCGAMSDREITDELLQAAMKEKTSVSELPRQSHTLNMLLVLLLLVVTYVMAFFT